MWAIRGLEVLEFECMGLDFRRICGFEGIGGLWKMSPNYIMIYALVPLERHRK